MELIQTPVSKVLRYHVLSNIAGSLLLVSRNLVDSYYVAQLSTSAMAAFALVVPVIFFIIGMSQSFSTASGIIVSRKAGQINRQPKFFIGSTLVIALILGMLLLVLTLTVYQPLISIYSAKADVESMAIMFSFYLLLGFPLVFVFGAASAVLRAIGHAPYVVRTTSIGILLGAIITPIYMFSGWAKAGQEFIGIPLGMNSGYLIAMSLMLHKLYKTNAIAFSPKLKLWYVQALKIVKEAIPILFNILITLVAMFLITGVISQEGIHALAAFSLVSRVEQFVLISINGVVLALMPFVGQNLGAKQHDRVYLGVQYGLKLMLYISVIALLCLALGASKVTSWFNLDAITGEYATLWLYAVAVALFFQGVALVVTALLQTLLRAKLATLLTILRLYLILIPALLVTSSYANTENLYWGIALPQVASGILLLIILLYYMNRYKPKRALQLNEKHPLEQKRS